ncbi:cysteine proteinase 2 precursor, putative [Entamoeba dispar SAW760]|uniref:Cysteine proteinase 2, putative n=1 Tax=Entamoeba dispar (strain ATCC PRA-260 / SAW760) TaxID=370354 RepID=B0ED64_ENTDS|nr:cysteine proteinase 2 precursor, putative [Entamoeba dispar SAW760]EDR27481.1 cysteine proteinase 2 precursor, putative [Entamoeba dispar SAW760]|eukprot:EDR27481.1 cysteine proteinase 2 precursor, putative [Entamoeba dispar SAW760]
MYRNNLFFLIVVNFSFAINFDQWKIKYNIKYSGSELLRRRAVFLQNSKLIQMINNQNLSFTVTNEGPFSVLTNEEYKMLHHRIDIEKEIKQLKSHKMNFLKNIDNKEVLDSIDWRSEGKVTPVKNQRKCASCYAFGSVATIESLIMQETHIKEIDLSEQQIVDCSQGEYSNWGCTCGNVGNSFNYIRDHGVLLERDYPYTGKANNCSIDGKKPVIKIKDYSFVFPQTEENLKIAVYHQPVAVSIDSSQPSFQFYEGGIYDEPNCKWVDHIVTVVGYGTTEEHQDFWIVKNSYGNEWGLNGYIYMSRNKNNQCGIATIAVYPKGLIIL